jgi:putative DNA primase/helicase
MASNYDDVLNQLHAGGLTGRGVDDGLQIGRLVRCKVDGDREKRGWYLLHELQTPNGDVLLVGSFGQWHGNDNGAQKIELAKTEFSSEQRSAMKARLAEDRKRVESARKAEVARAAEQARKTWAQAVEVEDNQYLARKAVQSYGLRQTPGGALIVPMLDAAGLIHGLQFIRTATEAKASQRPEKEYWPTGLAKKGNYFLIGTPQNVVLIAEGYATGASLHAATGLPVAVAFDAHNLAPVANALRKRYKCKILFCADDDSLAKCSLDVAGEKCSARFALAEHTKLCPKCGGEHKRSNAGVDAASAGALEVDGAWIKPVWENEAARIARFIANGHKHTDFNLSLIHI